MKKAYIIAALTLLAFAAGVATTKHMATPRPHLVVVPDPVLRTALQLEVNAEILPSTGNEWTDAVNATKLPLYKEGLAALSSLEIEDAELVTTDGLQYCVNLESLTLRNCGLTDISFVASMPHLSTLDLTGNRITDISPLRGFTNVRFLRLSDNQISDISPLSGLQNVYELGLRGNQIQDVSPLQNLRCNGLYLDQNQITSIPALTNMGLDKLVISNNNLDTDSCALLQDYRATDLIDVIHTDCEGVSASSVEEPLAPPMAATSPKSASVYTDGKSYHFDKGCKDTADRPMAGMLREDKAIKKGLSPCRVCVIPESQS